MTPQNAVETLERPRCQVCQDKPARRFHGDAHLCTSPDCFSALHECAAGAECEGSRFYLEDISLKRRGLCEPCAELADPDDGVVCEHCEQPATTYVGSVSMCEDSADN
jgi:hypothetical protein